MWCCLTFVCVYTLTTTFWAITIVTFSFGIVNDDKEFSKILKLFIIFAFKNSHIISCLSDAQLLWAICDLFNAGTETTATTLRYFILFLLHNPKIEQRMRKEIHGIVGESRFPSLADRSKLPYCDAVLYETLRVGSIAPFSVPHGLTQDLKFKGHLIPKDATIIPCLDSILNDPEIFENPSVFNPDRFIDENGKLKGTEKVLTFGIGKSTERYREGPNVWHR